VRKESVLLINRIVQVEFGGIFLPPDNLQNEAALDYILTAVSGTIYGRDLYPDVFSKASALLCTIIKQHVFLDGNKRTGIEVARLFLAKNDHSLITRPEDADYIIEVAKCTIGLTEAASWLREKSVPRAAPRDCPRERQEGRAAAEEGSEAQC